MATTNCDPTSNHRALFPHKMQKPLTPLFPTLILLRSSIYSSNQNTDNYESTFLQDEMFQAMNQQFQQELQQSQIEEEQQQYLELQNQNTLPTRRLPPYTSQGGRVLVIPSLNFANIGVGFVGPHLMSAPGLDAGGGESGGPGESGAPGSGGTGGGGAL